MKLTLNLADEDSTILLKLLRDAAWVERDGNACWLMESLMSMVGKGVEAELLSRFASVDSVEEEP